MRKIIIYLGTALLMFTLGTFTTVLFPSLKYTSEFESNKGTVSRLAEETEIASIVFRYQIEHASNLEHYAYYLSCYNYSDPSDKVIAYLNSNGLSAKVLSEVQHHSYSPDAPDIMFLRVGKIEWINDTEVVVGGSFRDIHWGNRETRAYVYRLLREDGGWKVISAETIS
jgi:hypothetical protein